MKEKIYDVGIIGCGPRGLAALEALYCESQNIEKQPTTIIFEIAGDLGAGPVYNLKQPDSNWLNVSERGIAIPPREAATLKHFTLPAFPDFQKWSGYSNCERAAVEVDQFPLRATLGKYLNERFLSIATVLEDNGLLKLVDGEVVSIAQAADTMTINQLGGESYKADEIAICIGHQPIELDEQLQEWKNRVANLDGVELFTQPYPVERILQSQIALKNKKIAIRGFGLAMIDVVRILSEGLGGRFDIVNTSTRKMQYVSSGREPEAVLAFSLDGLPMAPKPLNKEIDELYVPTAQELDRYRQLVNNRISSKDDIETTEFLTVAIAPIIAEKFIRLGEKAIGHSLTCKKLIALTLAWLASDDFKHKLITSKELSANQTMQDFVAMATGNRKVSLDYCIGQVWRHTQPIMYDLLSFAPLSDELIADIVQLDERLKRYSYGPPVDSLQQVLALVQSGKLDLSYVKDPKIELGEAGYRFTVKEESTTVAIMMNSVLDSPQILKVVSPLPKGLLYDQRVEPVHDKLGVRTKKNALIETENGVLPIAMMGRLAKGTLIGVDAIAECFGKRPKMWASGFVERFAERRTPSP